MKNQPKDVLKDGYDAVNKAGQGISAWSKMLNIIFSSFTRMYDKAIRTVVKGNVDIAYGCSDRAESDKWRKYAREINDNNVVKFMADFSEFDSSQESKGILASTIIMRQMGLDKDMLDFYLDMRKSWTLVSMRDSKAGNLITRLEGEWMQHSGQPHTIGGNTLFNMCAIGMCYEFKNLIKASFKGDDVAALAEKVREVLENGRSHIAVCGYKIKAFKPQIMEYIANIITPDGTFCADFLRRLNRSFGKIITPGKDWNEIRKSIADALDVFDDRAALENGCEVAAKYYQQQGLPVSYEDCMMMAMALYALRDCENLDALQEKEFTFIALP
jgi:hypothetical protein